MKKGFSLVEDDWVGFLDWGVAHPESYIVNFRKNADIINHMGYSECLYYFITLAIDSGAWLPHQLTADEQPKLDLTLDQVNDIHEAYTEPIQYDEPEGTYYTSDNDHYQIEQDFWYGPLKGAWPAYSTREARHRATA
jgi:hypothetical protein